MAHGTGAIKDTYDIRDYQFIPRGGFDWETGFDIEKKLGHKIVVKDQNGSGSCGGQAWAYYGEVLEALVTGNYEPRSARWIYAHTRVPPAGSNGRDNCDFVIKNGWALEAHAPSYEKGKPPSEEFMAIKPERTEALLEHSSISKALSYVQVPANIDLFAQAIQDNNGLVLAVYGEDNGTWRSEYPKPPQTKVWAHWLYAGKVKMKDGKKYIGVLNSWGNKTGKNGWQWIGEDYFKNGNVWNGWTLSWDYKPAKHKELLIQLVKLYQQLLTVMQSK